MPGVDAAIDALKGIGRTFSLGYFFPVTLFFLLNAGIFVAAFGIDRADQVVAVYRLGSAEGIALLLLLQLSVAWVIAPLAQGLRRLIEGELLPRPMRNLLSGFQRLDFERLKAKADRADAEYVQVSADVTDARTSLSSARGGSAKQVPRATAVQKIVRSVEALDGATTALRWSTDRWRAQASMVRSTLEAALKQYSADMVSGPGSTESDQLDRAQQRFMAKIEIVRDELKARAEALKGELLSRYVDSDIRPSRLGNLRAVMEDYTRSAYGVTFGFMWPRLQATISDTDPIAATLDQSRSQVEFAIVMLAGTSLTTFGWVTELAEVGTSVPLFLAIASGGLAAASMFYIMATASQAALTAAVRAAVDSKRLSVIQQLGLATPTNTSDERVVWAQLERLAMGVREQLALKQ